MLVREEQIRDRESIGSIHRRAFGTEHGTIVAALVDALRHGDPPALSLVCEKADEVVGHVMFSQCLLDAPRRTVGVTSLSPLGVAPEWQRQGVGSRLVRRGLRELDERGVPLVFLEGDPRYYSRLGFGPAIEQGFRKPSLRIPDRAFQVVKLSAYEPWMTGTFVYSETFWRHDCVGVRDKNA